MSSIAAAKPPATGKAPSPHVKKYLPTDSYFGDQLGTEFVIITVGSATLGQQFFGVHKKLICEKVPFFDKMLNGCWVESSTQKVSLPEDSPETFKLFLGWAYNGKLEISQLSGSIERYIRLFGFAEKYDISALLDAAIETLIGLLKENGWLLNSPLIGIAYEVTHSGSKLRFLAARSFAYATPHLSQDHVDGAWSKEKMHRIDEKHDDLWLDALDMMRLQAGKLQMNPRDQPLCDYHQHAKTEACLYLK